MGKARLADPLWIASRILSAPRLPARCQECAVVLVSLGPFMVVRLAQDHEPLGTGFCVWITSRPGLGFWTCAGLHRMLSRRVLAVPDQLQTDPANWNPSQHPRGETGLD